MMDMISLSAFRSMVMRSVIKFKDWTFLERNFSDEKISWQRAKEEFEKENKEWDSSKEEQLQTTKVFGLSENFKMFNDKAIESPKLDVVDCRNG